MNILNQLLEEKSWREFYAQKEAQKKIRPADLRELHEFIEKKEYLDLVHAILDGKKFSVPTKRLINKVGNTRKRVVYTFPKEENYVLKRIANLLYAYDEAFPSNLYSFRRKFGVKRAFQDLVGGKDFSGMCAYKVDVHDYFNSIDIDICVEELREVIKDDDGLLEFMIRILREERVIYEGEIIEDSHGIMAGMPLSSFLANVYLRKMDRYFEERNITYARYSDDIIVFAPNPYELEDHVTTIKHFLTQYRLEVNPAKEVYTHPGEPWSFLGIQYVNGETDISPISLNKVKAKFRRKARALLRWKRKKGLANIYAVKAFVKYVNGFFYNNTMPDEMTWARWYFPIITTDKSLKVLDGYTLELIRYILAEKHNKSKYNFKYSEIKDLGYRSLVAEYYSHM